MYEMLMEEIERLRKDLDGLDVGSKEYVAVADRLEKLVGRLIEIDKFNSDQDLKSQEINLDAEIKREQIGEDKKNRWIGYGLQVLGIVIPAGLTIWGTNKTIKFEETGSVTTFAGRNFFNNLFRKK
jgi:hypothetical protein